MMNVKYFWKMSRRSYKELISGTVDGNVKTVINRYSIVGANDYNDAMDSADTYAKLNKCTIAYGQVTNRHMVICFKYNNGKKHFRRYNW